MPSECRAAITICSRPLLYPQKKPLLSPPPQPLATTSLLSASRNLPVLDVSWKWSLRVSRLGSELQAGGEDTSRAHVAPLPLPGCSFPDFQEQSSGSNVDRSTRGLRARTVAPAASWMSPVEDPHLFPAVTAVWLPPPLTSLLLKS